MGTIMVFPRVKYSFASKNAWYPCENGTLVFHSSWRSHRDAEQDPTKKNPNTSWYQDEAGIKSRSLFKGNALRDNEWCPGEILSLLTQGKLSGGVKSTMQQSHLVKVILSALQVSSSLLS